MVKHFWREKNANYYKNTNEVVVPSEQELYEEIKSKFNEKLNMISVIFDKSKREEYLTKKNKKIPEGTPELVIQQKIGTRVIVDFLQLVKDMADLKKLSIKVEDNTNFNSHEQIQKSIKLHISNLDFNIEMSLKGIYSSIINLIEILSLNVDDLETERQRIEEKEGSFFKGKIVIM